jgi:H+/Cl- antiporter ClcA
MKRFTLDKETLSNRSFYQLILYAIVLGTVVGLATAVFLLIEHWLTELIWEEIPHRLGEFSLYALVVCTVGGLLVGLCQHFLGDYPKPMREALEDVRTQGGFDVAHVPHGVVSSLVSLSFGGALGPEAALIGLAGGLGTWVARRIKVSARQAHALAYFSVSGALGAFFRSPFGSAALPLESPE